MQNDALMMKNCFDISFQNYNFYPKIEELPKPHGYCLFPIVYSSAPTKAFPNIFWKLNKPTVQKTSATSR